MVRVRPHGLRPRREPEAASRPRGCVYPEDANGEVSVGRFPVPHPLSAPCSKDGRSQKSIRPGAQACIVASMKPAAFVLFALLFPISAVAQSFSIAYPSELSAQPLDGRLLLVLSTDPSDE